NDAPRRATHASGTAYEPQPAAADRLNTARVLLCGGGHAHLEVLRRLATAPDPAQDVILVSPEATAIYSGMLPGVIAGHYAPIDAAIPLVSLAHAAGATLVRDRVSGLDLDHRIARLASGNTLAFDA